MTWFLFCIICFSYNSKSAVSGSTIYLCSCYCIILFGDWWISGKSSMIKIFHDLSFSFISRLNFSNLPIVILLVPLNGKNYYIDIISLVLFFQRDTDEWEALVDKVSFWQIRTTEVGKRRPEQLPKAPGFWAGRMLDCWMKASDCGSLRASGSSASGWGWHSWPLPTAQAQPGGTGRNCRAQSRVSQPV